MTNNELVKLVNECLNNPEKEIKFYNFYDPKIPDICLDNPSQVLKTRAILLEGMYFPSKGVWYANYSLQDSDNKPIGNCIEIPLEFLDKFRKRKDPDSLTLFIHYKDERRLEVYVKKDKH